MPNGMLATTRARRGGGLPLSLPGSTACALTAGKAPSAPGLRSQRRTSSWTTARAPDWTSGVLFSTKEAASAPSFSSAVTDAPASSSARVSTPVPGPTSRTRSPRDTLAALTASDTTVRSSCEAVRTEACECLPRRCSRTKQVWHAQGAPGSAVPATASAWLGTVSGGSEWVSDSARTTGAVTGTCVICSFMGRLAGGGEPPGGGPGAALGVAWQHRTAPLPPRGSDAQPRAACTPSATGRTPCIERCACACSWRGVGAMSATRHRERRPAQPLVPAIPCDAHARR